MNPNTTDTELVAEIEELEERLAPLGIIVDTPLGKGVIVTRA